MVSISYGNAVICLKSSDWALACRIMQVSNIGEVDNGFNFWVERDKKIFKFFNSQLKNKIAGVLDLYKNTMTLSNKVLRLASEKY